MHGRYFNILTILLIFIFYSCAGDLDDSDFFATSVITFNNKNISVQNTGDITFSGDLNFGLDSLIQVEKPFDDQSDWPFNIKKENNSFTISFDNKKTLPNKTIRVAVSGLSRESTVKAVYVTGYIKIKMVAHYPNKKVNISIAQVATSYNAAMEAVGYVNIERKKVGANPLIYNDDLQKASEVRAQEISQKFSHTRPDGTSCFSASPNKAMSGENIAAAGAASPKVVVGMWMGSTGHKANILNKSFKTMGQAGYCKDSSNYVYWSQNFGW